MTAPLAKAILVRLKEIKGSGKDPTPTLQPEDKGAFEVQFNPTSLRITRQNNIDHGASTTKTVRRQNPSVESATLTFDLEFDSAEDVDPPPSGSQASGTPTSATPHAVDVRKKTLIVRQFAEPSSDKPTSPPPPVRFIWGTFVFTGLVTQITEDLDYFSSDGRPLRAKVSVTITEKNPDWEAKLTGSAARNQPSGGGQGSGPGSAPASNPDTAALAQAGESLQQLLSRLNADPATWRAAMAGLSSPLGLAAGAQVQLAAGVSASAGLGASAGFALGANASASATLGAALGISASAGTSVTGGASLTARAALNAGAGFSASADASVSAGFTAGGGVAVDAAAAAGFSLAEGGGVAASYAVVAGAGAAASVAAARNAFSVPDAPAGAAASVQLGAASVGSLAASAQVDLDPRAQGYGMGIPLGTRAQATTVVSTTNAGSGVVTARSSVNEVSLTADASIPPWMQLPLSASARTTADVRQRQRDAGDNTLRWGPGR